MLIVSTGDSLNEMSKPLFWDKKQDKLFRCLLKILFYPASYASDWWSGVFGIDPRRVRRHSFMKVDHEMFCTFILSVPLIQEEQVPVSGERLWSSTGYPTMVNH